MTEREVLKLALETMEAAIKAGDWKVDGACDPDMVFVAIREALAQPEQEPVAWGMMNDDGKIYDCICPEEHDRVEGEYTIPLYTSPPQRTWQGLTLADKREFTQQDFGGSRLDAMDWAEQRLKEKNA